VKEEQLELAAWRFLAAHRVGSLSVTHLLFTDSERSHVSTPSVAGFYATAEADTFGEAAIELALELGMPWDTDCGAEPSDSDQVKNSVAIAVDGESGSNLPAIRLESEDSTIGATGAALSEGMRHVQDQQGDEDGCPACCA
jgi:hypothetical protein